tara:strand:- start:351 stop:1097 length:747 start_codon:yes stop_codon:yes gene_type:complete
MCKEQNPNIIIVSTPDHTHVKILNTIIKFKPLAVICEKPLSTEVGEIKKIIKKYNSLSINLHVNFSYRYNKLFQDLKKDIDKNRYGKALSFRVTYSRGFFHNACHFIDLANWYFGKYKQVSLDSYEKSKSYDGDFNASIKIKYGDNIEAMILGVDIPKIAVCGMEMIFSNAIIRITYDDVFELYKLRKNIYQPNENEYYIQARKKIDYGNLIQNILNNVFESIYKKSKIISSSEDALNVAKIYEKLTI